LTFFLLLSISRPVNTISKPSFTFARDSVKSILPSPQKDGDPAKGKEYLIYGDYVSSGLPYSMFLMNPNQNGENHLKREGINATIPYNYTALRHANGRKIVAPNCLQCHAGFIRDSFYLGLGNSVGDFTRNPAALAPSVSFMIKQTYGDSSLEAEAYQSFKQAVMATGPYLKTEVIGANPADKLTALLAAHRDPVTLEWQEEPIFPVDGPTIPTDTPPWWVLKKKNAMFYTGIGRGDFAKYLMGSSLLTLKDSSEAAEIYPPFADVLAFIKDLEAPKFPGIVDEKLAQTGKIVFEEHCSKCHGTYGEIEEYPNYLVPLSIIKTDPLLSDSYQASYGKYLNEWLNNSWFAKGKYRPHMVAEGGYVAQPLDGIWATAPYLHNGSVPNLETLLNSEIRPDKWRRVEEGEPYDLDNVGWKFTVEEEKKDKYTYDTSKPGYGNEGHYFGDKLSVSERMAVIEYLKTL
jgi:hypothetical protein